jgi:hypothetical protein
MGKETQNATEFVQTFMHDWPLKPTDRLAGDGVAGAELGDQTEVALRS